MLDGEDQTANAREPVINWLKTDESHSWKNELALNFRDDHICLLAENERLMLANMEHGFLWLDKVTLKR